MTNPLPTPSHPDAEDLRLQALKLLLNEAERAATEGNSNRFDELITRLLADGRPPLTDEPSEHDRTMDRWRVVTTAVMVLALFIIIVSATFFSERAANNAAQFVSLFSGLAGIALGWLFGAGTGSSRRSLTTSSAPAIGTTTPPGTRRRGSR
jgi:hypothetical protein